MSRVVLVTGASGFVGQAVCRKLAERSDFAVRGAVRGQYAANAAHCVRVGDLGAETDWSEALDAVDSVIHTAARVHILDDSAADPLAEFRRVNVEGTLALARQCVNRGVRRFVYLSSIKVNGEETARGKPYLFDDAPNPLDAYGISKLEAEEGLQQIAADHGLELVIIRPPLVYGPGVRANFRAMMAAIYRRLPLPLGRVIGNRRSLVSLENLSDLIMTCVDHSGAPGRVFLASDGEDLSTAALLRRLGDAMGRSAILLPVPPKMLELAAAAIGRRAIARRLLGSLQVDVGATRKALDWTPPFSVDEGLELAARHFVQEQSR